jgi:hypothetical protein
LSTQSAKIRFEFTSPYRDGTKNWSTTFHCTGPEWADHDAAYTYSNGVWTAIQHAVLDTTTLNTIVAYNPGSDIPVYTMDWEDTGGYNDHSNPMTALEECMLIKWDTDARSVRNHPVYLFNFFHHVQSEGATNPDILRSGMRTTMDDNLATILAGISDGHITRFRCGPRAPEVGYDQPVATGAVTQHPLHHRDFPR